MVFIAKKLEFCYADDEQDAALTKQRREDYDYATI